MDRCAVEVHLGSQSSLEVAQVVVPDLTAGDKDDDRRRVDPDLNGVEDLGSPTLPYGRRMGALPAADHPIERAGRNASSPILQDDIQGGRQAVEPCTGEGRDPQHRSPAYETQPVADPECGDFSLFEIGQVPLVEKQDQPGARFGCLFSDPLVLLGDTFGCVD